MQSYSNTYREGTSSQLDSLESIPHYATHNDCEESESYHEHDILEESMEIDLIDTFLNLDNFSINT